MKLKLVVLSMSMLGLVGSQASFADTDAKHKQHPKAKHHVVRHHVPAEEREFKSLGVAPVVSPVVCTPCTSTVVMEEMTQSIGRAMPNPCNPGWFNRIHFSGGMNFDAGKWGHHSTEYMGENYKHFSVNDAYLNIAATVNDWARAFASISFDDASRHSLGPVLTDGIAGAPTYTTGEYSAAYSDNIHSDNGSTIHMQQAYVTLGNLEISPVFVQVGKQFQDFGRYELHPITRSVTQSMSEILATSVKLGFIAEGFNGSVYGFDDSLRQVHADGNVKTSTNFGVSLGYSHPNDCFGYNIGAGYLYNLIGVNDVAFNVAQNNGGTVFHRRVGGVSVYGDVNSGPFTLAGRYVTAVKRFSSADLTPFALFDIGIVDSSKRPWAADLTAGYSFEAFDCRHNNIYLGYQASRHTGYLDLPKERWQVGYDIDVWKWTNFGIEYDHDKGFGRGHGRNQNLVSLRTAIEFA